jgi:hypothetical protein
VLEMEHIPRRLKRASHAGGKGGGWEIFIAITLLRRAFDKWIFLPYSYHSFH